MHEEFLAFRKASEKDVIEKIQRYSEILECHSVPYYDLDAARLFREGIPPLMRRAVWLQITGVGAKIRRERGVYLSLLESEENSDDSGVARKQIEIDLDRTFGNNSKMNNEATKTAMYNILWCYSRHNRSVGYCQSMMFIVSALLLVEFSEEEAFWMLDYIISMMPDCYDATLSGTAADTKVLSYYIEKKLPRLHEYLTSRNVDNSLYLTPMLMCLYVGYVPYETMFRVWDRIMFNGILELFRSALKFLNFIQEKIIAENLNCDENVEICQSIVRLHQLLVDADGALAIMPGKQEMEHGQLQFRRMRFRDIEQRSKIDRVDDDNDDEEDSLEEVCLETKLTADMVICDIDDQ